MVMLWEDVESENSECSHAANQWSDTVTCSCIEDFLPSPEGDIVVVRVRGDVDLISIPLLEATLNRSIDRRPAHLIVDLAELQFCSARGMRLLLHAGMTATDQGLGYAVSSAPSLLNRMWEKLFRPDDLPVRYCSVAAAVRSLGAQRDIRLQEQPQEA